MPPADPAGRPSVIERALRAIREQAPNRDLLRALLEAGWDIYVDDDGAIHDWPPTLEPKRLLSPNGRFVVHVTNDGILELLDTQAQRHAVRWSTLVEVDP